tara:strand:+ start:129 stop:353 length:225 start_codon:yes stop_codon:yes gene_type:complete
MKKILIVLIFSILFSSNAFSSITDQYACQRATKTDGSSFDPASNSFYVKTVQSRGITLSECNQLTGRGNNQSVT